MNQSIHDNRVQYGLYYGLFKDVGDRVFPKHATTTIPNGIG